MSPRCRVIVTKERLEERWPVDPEFRAFAAKLADAVQRALGEGVKIGRNGWCRCPLGCVLGAQSWQPSAYAFAPGAPGTPETRRYFIAGFDGPGSVYESYAEEGNPYYRLGQAYRRRFTVAS